MQKFEIKLVTTVTTDVEIEADSQEDAVAQLRAVAERFTFSLPLLKNTVRHAVYVKGEGVDLNAVKNREIKPKKKRNTDV